MPGMFRRFKRIDDCLRIATLNPTIGRHRPFTFAVSASIHHYNAVAGGKQNQCVLEDSDAIVSDTVEHQHPIAVGLRCAHFPSTEQPAIVSSHIKVFAPCVNLRKRNIRIAN